jgi:glycine betaine/proline transport system substrate-binding protein
MPSFAPWYKCVGAALAAGLFLLSPPASAQPESKDPIKLTINDWSGQIISTKIMGSVLKSAGYNVEYVQADYLAQLTGLQSGDLTAAMEIWATTGKEALEAAVATGKVVNLGETGMLSKEEWWVPQYMLAKCPGLPDWKALNGCAKMFSTVETAPKGRYLGGPVTWGGFDEERVKNLPMDFEVVHAGTDAALFAELEAAYSKEQPIVLWVYAPHWVPIKYKGEWIKFPPYTAECYASGKYNCAKPEGPIWKAAWVGMAQKWPKAAEAVKAFRISNDDMGKLVERVDVKGEDLDAVVADWIASNKGTWGKWLM